MSGKDLDKTNASHPSTRKLKPVLFLSLNICSLPFLFILNTYTFVHITLLVVMLTNELN